MGDAKGKKDSQMGAAFSEDLLHWTQRIGPSRAGQPSWIILDSQVVEPGGHR